MIVTREQVMAALLTKLSSAATFKTIGRRNRNPETISSVGSPALILVEHSESYQHESSQQPPIRRLMVRAVVYTDVGTNENAIPSAVINDILDAIDGLLVPDDQMTGRCTLGGLVQSVLVDGTVTKAPGDITGKGLAIVPLTILLP